MKQQKGDRRSQRTQNLVRDALIALLVAKPYEGISVQDILNQAGIGRTTFYAHYFDKKDALESMIGQTLDVFRQQIARRETGQTILPFADLFVHVHEQWPVFQALFLHGGPALWEIGQAMVQTTIEDRLALMTVRQPIAHIPSTAIAHYLAGAFFNLLKWWLQTEQSCSPEQMTHIFEELVMPGVQSLVEGTRTECGRIGN